MIYKIISTTSLIFSVFAIFLVQRIPFLMQDKLKGKRFYKNSHNLQIESYFRKSGNEEIKYLLGDWISLIVKMEQKVDTKFIVDLSQRTILLGSSETISILASFTQFNYTHDNHSNDNDFSYTMIIYIAKIISSLKHDFTGYTISPLDILKIKISDYNEHKETFERIYKNLEE